MHYPTLSNRTQCLKKYRLHFSVFSIVRFSHVFLLNLECLWFSFIAFLYLSVYISLFLSSIFVKWKKSFWKGSVNLNVCKIAWAEIALTIQKEEVFLTIQIQIQKRLFDSSARLCNCEIENRGILYILLQFFLMFRCFFWLKCHFTKTKRSDEKWWNWWLLFANEVRGKTKPLSVSKDWPHLHLSLN